jgi:hypothetical protein
MQYITLYFYLISFSITLQSFEPSIFDSIESLSSIIQVNGTIIQLNIVFLLFVVGRNSSDEYLSGPNVVNVSEESRDQNITVHGSAARAAARALALRRMSLDDPNGTFNGYVPFPVFKKIMEWEQERCARGFFRVLFFRGCEMKDPPLQRISFGLHLETKSPSTWVQLRDNHRDSGNGTQIMKWHPLSSTSTIPLFGNQRSGANMLKHGIISL